MVLESFDSLNINIPSRRESIENEKENSPLYKRFREVNNGYIRAFGTAFYEEFEKDGSRLISPNIIVEGENKEVYESVRVYFVDISERINEQERNVEGGFFSKVRENEQKRVEKLNIHNRTEAQRNKLDPPLPVKPISDEYLMIVALANTQEVPIGRIEQRHIDDIINKIAKKRIIDAGIEDTILTTNPDLKEKDDLDYMSKFKIKDYENSHQTLYDHPYTVCSELEKFTKIKTELTKLTGVNKQSSLAEIISQRKSELSDLEEWINTAKNIAQIYKIEVNTLQDLEDFLSAGIEVRSNDFKLILNNTPRDFIEVLSDELNRMELKDIRQIEDIKLPSIFSTGLSTEHIIKISNPSELRELIKTTSDIYSESIKSTEYSQIPVFKNTPEKAAEIRDSDIETDIKEQIQKVLESIGIDPESDIFKISGKWEVSNVTLDSEKKLYESDTPDNLVGHRCYIRKYFDKKHGVEIILNIVDKNSNSPGDFAIKVSKVNKNNSDDFDEVLGVELIKSKGQSSDPDWLSKVPRKIINVAIKLSKTNAKTNDRLQELQFNIDSSMVDLVPLTSTVSLRQSRDRFNIVSALARLVLPRDGIDSVSYSQGVDALQHSDDRTIGNTTVDLATKLFKYARVCLTKPELFTDFVFKQIIFESQNGTFLK